MAILTVGVFSCRDIRIDSVGYASGGVALVEVVVNSQACSVWQCQAHVLSCSYWIFYSLLSSSCTVVEVLDVSVCVCAKVVQWD